MLAQLATEGRPRDDVALVLLQLPAEPAVGPLLVCRQLPAATSSSPLSRQFLRDVLGHWGVAEDTVETAALLTTELVSNATRNSDEGIELRLEVHPDRLRVSVFDSSHRLPQVCQAGAEDTSGRGLRLVEVLSDRWGVEPHDLGKTVWFEMATVP